MKYKEIISSAWISTRKNKKLIIWYGFLPSLLTTLIGIISLMYQLVATYNSQLFSDKPKSILKLIAFTIVEFIETHPKAGLALLIVAIIIGLLYLLLPTLLQGGLIQLTARIYNKQKVKISDGISFGLLSFLALFEYHLLVKGFGIVSFLTEAAFIGRNLGWDALKIMLIPLFLFTIIGVFLVLLFTYTEYFIVIDKEPVFTSIRKSGKLVIEHWAQTFLILILMLIISIRIIVNIILVLAIPALIIIPAGYMATIVMSTIGYIIGGIIGAIALVFASYLGGILEVFATFVWVKTFLELTTEGEISAREKSVSARDVGGE